MTHTVTLRSTQQKGVSTRTSGMVRLEVAAADMLVWSHAPLQSRHLRKRCGSTIFVLHSSQATPSLRTGWALSS
jgi:hypothetical protein